MSAHGWRGGQAGGRGLARDRTRSVADGSAKFHGGSGGSSSGGTTSSADGGGSIARRPSRRRSRRRCDLRAAVRSFEAPGDAALGLASGGGGASPGARAPGAFP